MRDDRNVHGIVGYERYSPLHEARATGGDLGGEFTGPFRGQPSASGVVFRRCSAMRVELGVPIIPGEICQTCWARGPHGVGEEGTKCAFAPRKLPWLGRPNNCERVWTSKGHWREGA